VPITAVPSRPGGARSSQTAASPQATLPGASAQAGWSAWLRGLVERVRQWRRPTFSMYTVPRSEVEAVIRAGGGELLAAIDDNAAGAGWQSYTYVCRRVPES
jgi:hypothetical protein